MTKVIQTVIMTFLVVVVAASGDSQPVFTDITDQAGVALTDQLVESVAWGDYDNDGDEDLYLTGDGPNHLYRNNGGGFFTEVTDAVGVGNGLFSVGAAFGDLDNDGDLDLVVTADAGEPTRLWRNDTDVDHHWLTIKLVGNRSNRSAIGAGIELTTNLGSQVQEVSGGAGRGSQNSLPVEFGLGQAGRVRSMTIRWPSGTVQVIRDPAIDAMHTVVEPENSRTGPRRAAGRRGRR